MDNGESTSDESTPPVVLCCAAPDEATARVAADALLGRGHDVELVIGVETGRAELKSAITRLNSQGLYVLCRSAAMPRATIDELRAVLRAQEVPFGRTLTLAIEAKRPRALEERIVSVLRRMGASRPAKAEAPKTPAASPPEAAKPSPSEPVAAPQPFAADPAEEAVDADEIAEWADSLVGDVPDFGEDDDEPGPTLEGIPPESAAAAYAAPAPDYEAPLVTSVAPPEPVRGGDTVIQRAPTDPALEKSGAAAAPLATVVPAAPDLTPPAAPSLAPAAVPSLAPSAPALASAASGPQLGPPSGPSIPEPDLDEGFAVGGPLSRALGGPTGMMVVLGGGAVLLIIVLVVAFSGGDDSADAPKVASAEAKAKEETAPDTKSDTKPADGEAADDAAAEDSAKSDDGEATPPAGGDSGDGAEAAPEGGDAAGDEGLVEPAGEGGAEPAAGGDPPPPATPAAPVEVRRKAPDAEHYEPPATPAPAPSEPVPAGDADSPAVAEALRNREVRALDLFVVALEGSDAMAHDSAVAYCAAMEVAGLSEWRVPMLGELNSVIEGGLAGKGTYWSSTLGDAFGDTRILVNARKNRMGAAKVGYEGASVLCIRDR